MKSSSLVGTTHLQPELRARLLLQLRVHPLFGGLPDDQARAVADDHDIMAVRAGVCFIEEGQESNMLYIVLTGRCSIMVKGESIGTVGRGAVLGELGMLANTTRSATVTTTRDTVLARLPKRRLDRLTEKAPLLWRALGECAARRAVGSPIGEEVGRGALAIAILGVGEVDLEPLGAALVDSLRQLGPTAEIPPGAGVEGLLLQDEAERHNDFVVYRADPNDEQWTQRCLRQADRIILVGDGTRPPPALDAVAKYKAPVYLWLQQPADIAFATGTAVWLDALECTSHHHLRRGDQQDLHRATRLLAGRGTGLSFAGASSRGVGHYGLIRALGEAGVVADSVTGSSAGGLVAASVAMRMSEEESLAFFSAVLDCLTPSARKLTAPLVALMTGQEPVDTLQRLCNGIHIEDLMVPLQIPATDLLRAERYVFRRGPMWRALRATGSLPLFWPPLIWDGRVLVDSGLISNQPVDLLQEGCGLGKMVAQDLLPADLTQGPLGGLDDAAAVSGWRVLWERIWPFANRSAVPLLPDTIIHAMTIPSYQAQRAWDASRHANTLMLCPDLPNYSFFGVTVEQQRALVDEVYSQSVEALAESTASEA